MQETPEILLEETSKLLDELISVVQRNIDALQHDSNPLLQHLIQQEIEHYQQLMERTEETKDRLQDLLNSQETEPERTDSQEDGPEESESETVEPEEDESQEVEPEVTEPDVDISLARTQLVSDIPGYPPGGRLAVTMPNGEKIRRSYSIDTFAEVLEKIGLERISELDIRVRYTPLVSIVPNNKVRQRESGIYHITVDAHLHYMVKILMRIAATFDIDLVIENYFGDNIRKYKKYPKKDPLDFLNF